MTYNNKRIARRLLLDGITGLMVYQAVEKFGCADSISIRAETKRLSLH
jgi:hypothetical protein